MDLKGNRVSVIEHKWGPRDNRGVRSIVEIPKRMGVPTICYCPNGPIPVELPSMSEDYKFKRHYTCWLAAPGNSERVEPCGFLKWSDIAVLEEIQMLRERCEQLDSKIEVIQEHDQMLQERCHQLEMKYEDLQSRF